MEMNVRLPLVKYGPRLMSHLSCPSIYNRVYLNVNADSINTVAD